MANYIFHKAEERGYANHGWLKANHSFSFANYYNPAKMHFGALRVLNDDYVEGGMGFGMHPHDNMEIITIPLEGDLAHKDSMGNGTTIKHGDVQVMSAGTGIRHSEFNANADKPVKLLQIWIFPNKQQVEPRYQQITLAKNDAEKIRQIVSPNMNDAGVWIHQNAWIHLVQLNQNEQVSYPIKQSGDGVYAFNINGQTQVDNHLLKMRDAIGITETENITIENIGTEKSEMILIEVPMNY